VTVESSTADRLGLRTLLSECTAIGRKAALESLFSGLAALTATTGVAAEDRTSAPQSGESSKPSWDFSITLMPTAVRGGEDYTTVVAAADRGPLHLEARANYESVGARSAFVGWNFSGGETVTWQVTPLLGGAWADTRAFIPGAEAAVAWRWLDFYIEAEYVRDSDELSDSYFYSWSEVGVTPFDWLRFGLAGQRTRAYDNERNLQRGPFVQLTWRQLTVGAYWFNPGSSEQVVVGSIAATF
jgi:hypothetical protein